MTFPTARQFNLFILRVDCIVQDEEAEIFDHVLTRYLTSDGTQVPFPDGSTDSTVYTNTSEETAGFAIDESSGVLIVDVPTAGGIVTRQSKEFGTPGSWTTVGA